MDLKGNILNKLAWPLLGLLGVLAVSRIVYPFDLGLYESVTWSAAHLAINGHNPYAYAFLPPYVMAPYGYFYYLLIGLGLSFGDNFIWGRLLSVMAAGVVVWSLFQLAPKYRFNPKTASLFFLASVPAMSMLGVHRPDMIALACGMAAFVMVGRNTVVAALLAFGAVFFKQTFFLMPLIVGLTCQEKWKFYGVGIALCACMLLALDGDYFWQHFILTQSIPVIPWRSWDVLLTVCLSPAMLLIFYVKPGKPFIWLMPALLVACLTASRAGSNANYYLEAMVPLSVLVAKKRNLLWIVALCGLFQVTRSLHGEYNRWCSVSYLRKVEAEYRQYNDGPGVSVYADMIPNAEFPDWIQYTDGRSADLGALFTERIHSKRYKAVLWPNPNDPALSDYRMVPIEGYSAYPVYLYVLK